LKFEQNISIYLQPIETSIDNAHTSRVYFVPFCFTNTRLPKFGKDLHSPKAVLQDLT